MSSAPKLLRLFATPVIADELEDSAALNSQLETAILARQATDPGVNLSNRGGWQSKRDFREWTGEAGSRLIERAAALATAHSAGPAGNRWRIDVWANVSGSGHFNMPHVHGGSFWSAVYYVRLGEGEGGQLILHDPRMPALRMHAPWLRFADTGPEIRAEIQPKPGLMILFPAWLSHSVEPWQGTGDRISVAMNIRAAPPPAA